MTITQILSAQPGTKLLVEVSEGNTVELPIVAWALVRYDNPLNREVQPLVIVPDSIVPVLAAQVHRHYQPKEVRPYGIKIPR